MGLKWMTGSISGVGSDRPCAFQEGDIFYLEANWDTKPPHQKTNCMMNFLGLVLWNEPPLAKPLDTRFMYSGVLHNQLFGQSWTPTDLLARVPQRVNRSVLYSLHSTMPLFFCHPDKAANVKYVDCIRRATGPVYGQALSMDDIDMTQLANKQRNCGE